MEAEFKPVSEETSNPDAAVDRADLSSASSLLALAKATPGGKHERLVALAARVGAGTYKPAAREISRSIVNNLLKK
jgi:hypothetical protein